MDVPAAYRVISQNLRVNVGRFYGPFAALSLGAGLLYAGIRYPLYDHSANIFQTVEGLIFILTHECDIAEENDRAFNEDVLICPIIPLDGFVAEFSQSWSDDKITGFLHNLAARRISRLMYFPTLANVLPYGGVLFLNQIAHTKVTAFGLPGAVRVGTVSAFGFQEVGFVIRNHLLREKAELLPFQIH